MVLLPSQTGGAQLAHPSRSAGRGLGERSRAAAARAAPGLMAVTVLEELQRRHPERFGDSVLRTLQRRMRQWRAEHGAEREIFFAQEHPPGRLGLSDFTVADELGRVHRRAEAFPHRLYQFAFAHSGWRHALRRAAAARASRRLTAGLAGGAVDGRRGSRGASHRQPVGGVQQPGRTAKSSRRRYRGAVRALRHAREPQQSGREPRERLDRIASGQPEARPRSGAAAARHARVCEPRPAYEQFVAETVRRLNARAAPVPGKSSAPRLQALPARRTVDFEEIDARVSKFGVFSAKSVLYSVPSRLVGHRLKVRLLQRPSGGVAGRGEGVRV